MSVIMKLINNNIGAAARNGGHQRIIESQGGRNGRLVGRRVRKKRTGGSIELEPGGRRKGRQGRYVNILKDSKTVGTWRNNACCAGAGAVLANRSAQTCCAATIRLASNVAIA
jgi:hypothetical protein